MLPENEVSCEKILFYVFDLFFYIESLFFQLYVFTAHPAYNNFISNLR